MIQSIRKKLYQHQAAKSKQAFLTNRALFPIFLDAICELSGMPRLPDEPIGDYVARAGGFTRGQFDAHLAACRAGLQPSGAIAAWVEQLGRRVVELSRLQTYAKRV